MKREIKFFGGPLSGSSFLHDDQKPLAENIYDYQLNINDREEIVGYVYREPTATTKSLSNTCSNGATKNVKDIVFWGDGDTFKLISKASSEYEGWMKSTKAMQCGDSVVVQVTTQQRNPDGSYSLAEALTTVANAKIVEDGNTSEGTIARRIINN